MAELSIDGLAKAFAGRPVLRDLSLQVAAGELVAILGASGSGKTTLLRLLGGFERADAGCIRVGDRVVAAPGRHLAPERRRIGYVTQDGALFPHLSVAANIAFGLTRTQRRARHRVDELLRLVGLSPSMGDRSPEQLSGGEQQRVALARALAPEPGLLLLDEPFSALDAALRQSTRQVVAEALAAAGATALLVTHDQAEALSMGHRVAVLRQGRLVQVADPETLYRRPVDAALAGFVGEAVLLPGTAAQGVAVCALGALPLFCGSGLAGAVEVMVRPEQLRLDAADGGVAARVVGVSFHGPDALVALHLAAGDPLTARVPGHATPRRGEMVRLRVEGAVMAYPHGR
jgi:iron(III) transport system ATP-binding protein